ncbi:hypothetical protein D3C72_1723160 [compost metagenome]
MHFLRREDFIGRNFPGVQDLTFQRHDRLEFTIARLLGGTACRVPFDEEQLGAIQILRGAIRQFTRQRRTTGELFTHHFFRGTHTALRAGDRHFSQHFSCLYVLIQPQAKCVFYHTRDKRGALARGQTLFGLSGKLRILHFHRKHVRTAIPDIFC